MNVRNLTNTVLKEKAQSPYSTLYQCAKDNPERKFHALQNKIHRPDILKTSWLKVKGNKGSAGIDDVIIDQIVDEIWEWNFLNELYKKLKNRTYRLSPVKRVWIPKANSDKMRPLGILLISKLSNGSFSTLNDVEYLHHPLTLHNIRYRIVQMFDGPKSVIQTTMAPSWVPLSSIFGSWQCAFRAMDFTPTSGIVKAPLRFAALTTPKAGVFSHQPQCAQFMLTLFRLN